MWTTIIMNASLMLTSIPEVLARPALRMPGGSATSLVKATPLPQKPDNPAATWVSPVWCDAIVLGRTPSDRELS